MGRTQIRIFVVGDSSVGKTCALTTYTTNKFPTEKYLPTIIVPYSAKMNIDGIKINLGLWDSVGQEDFKELKPPRFHKIDLFLLFFAVNEYASYVNAQQKWYQELHTAQPNVPIVLVGSKIDLRKEGEKFITSQQAYKTAQQLGCEYLECSAKDKIGINELIEEAIRIALREQKKKQSCQIF